MKKDPSLNVTNSRARYSEVPLHKLGIAPNNESYLINILRFIKVIDDAGNVTSESRKIFSNHSDAQFAEGLGTLVKSAYPDLFQLHGETTWTLDEDNLITFFRGSDQSSSIVGKRQAKTFRTLASLSGHGDVPEPKSNLSTKTRVRPRKEIRSNRTALPNSSGAVTNLTFSHM